MESKHFKKMKAKLFIIVFSFFLLACSNDDEKEFELPPKMNISADWDQLIIGKWKYIQSCEYGIISSGCRSPLVTNNYTFQDQSVVLYDSFINNCEEGTYNIEGRKIHFSFECINHQFDIEIYALSDQYLIFTYTGDDSVIYRVYESVN